jgi:two-component system sensor histidine kinase RegB
MWLQTGALIFWRPRLALQEPAPLSVAAELVMDMTALAALLFFTGGVSNPFASLLLLPLALAANTLSARWLVALTTLAAILFGALLIYNVALVRPDSSAERLFELHRFGMWLSFVIAATLIGLFLASAAHRLREATRDIAKLRNRLLRDETVHAVALQAAHTAHALNTPMMTVATGLGELSAQAASGAVDAAELARDVEFLRQQLSRCIAHTRALSGVAAQAGAEPKAVLLSTLLELLRGDAALLAPNQALHIVEPMAAELQACKVLDDGTLRWVLWGLVQNGWEASAMQPVELRAEREAEVLRIDVHDTGKSFADQTPTQRPAQGLGIGLTLSHASLERLGGSLSLLSDASGTIARVRIPQCP